MTKVDIYSGFLGAGKTTLIKKMIQEAYEGEKLVLIENEFGEISIDGGFLQEAGIEITEMNSGCICCSLVGDFGQALEKVIKEYAPDRILIEPSGVGKLSDVIAAVRNLKNSDVQLCNFVTVADAGKCKIYMKNFGEFYNNQIETANTIILSRTGSITEEKLQQSVDLIRQHNETATLITTPWEQLTGKQIQDAMERSQSLDTELKAIEEQTHGHRHGEGCGCEHRHHDHHHDEGCGCEHGHHSHHHDETCGCGHDHHGHHHADEVFTSWGLETPKKFTTDQIARILEKLDDAGHYGLILRAKGIVAGEDGSWIHFDYVPAEPDVRTGSAAVIGRICVIGSNLHEDAIQALFGV